MIKELSEEEETFEDEVTDNNGKNEVTDNEVDSFHDIDDKSKKSREKYLVHGISVSIINEDVQYMDADGRLITMSIIDYSRMNLKKVYPMFDEFKKVWIKHKKKNELINELVEDGILIDYIREKVTEDNVDDFDILANLGYDHSLLTRDERIDYVLESGYLSKFNGENLEIVELLLEAYRTKGIDELKKYENIKPSRVYPKEKSY